MWDLYCLSRPVAFQNACSRLGKSDGDYLNIDKLALSESFIIYSAAVRNRQWR